ncbi:MAG: hypothetical protein JRC68_09335 [Deltaproteobacteria bacterium]|nr:hypothetical protein [Deltaproteobacteria bacterium]
MFQLKFDIQRKYLFIVLGILLFLGLIYRFFPFLQEFAFPAQEIALKERRLIKYQKMVAAGSNLDKRLVSLNGALKALEGGLLTGKTAPLAAVEIQQILQEIADKSHVQIRSVKVLKPVELEKKNYLSIPVEFYMIPTIRQLKEVLYRIETSPKYLTVQKVSARYFPDKQRRCRCRITIAGFMKRGKV